MEYVVYKGALTARVAVDHALRAVETLGPEKSTFDDSPSIFVYSALLHYAQDEE